MIFVPFISPMVFSYFGQARFPQDIFGSILDPKLRIPDQ